MSSFRSAASSNAKRSKRLTLDGIIKVIVVVARLSIAPAKAKAVGTESGDGSNSKAIVGADTLALEHVLVSIVIASKVNVAAGGKLNERLANSHASLRNVVALEGEIRASKIGERTQGQSEGLGVHFDGVEEVEA